MTTRSDAAPASTPLPRTAYTVPEVARSLGIPQRAVRSLIHSDQLGGRRDGQRFVVPVAALAAYLGMTLGDLREHLNAS